MTNLCLDIDILAAYIDGSLGDDEKKAAETHIASCDECMEEFVLATLLLNDEELAEYEPEYSQMSRQTDAQTALHEAGDTIRTKISDWLAALSPPEWLLPQNSLSFVRGSKDRTDAVSSIFIRKSINELQAEMYIEKNEDSLSSEQWRLWIKVFKNSEAAKNVSLTLMREDGLPYARFLNYGYVLFDRQPYGSYSLTVEQAAYLKSEKTEPFEKNVPYCFEINHAGFYEK
ncbi:MAG: hypothetical protein BWK80_35270 [Desulfobacteraceae bacterium IS3]|nr:MAG: hypothetical protein BWK80_35270 [Desulfobacteraceae bacterium IS3]